MNVIQRSLSRARTRREYAQATSKLNAARDAYEEGDFEFFPENLRTPAQALEMVEWLEFNAARLATVIASGRVIDYPAVRQAEQRLHNVYAEERTSPAREARIVRSRRVIEHLSEGR